jgi:hypothetical protein
MAFRAHRVNGTADEKDRAKIALTHIIGSLAVRAEDKYEIALEPWSYFAAELGRVVSKVAWPLRTLLFLLTERSQTVDQRAQLGSASRDLLQYGLVSADQIVTAAIGFVGDTYGSDPAASRQLLGSLFLPDRFTTCTDAAARRALAAWYLRRWPCIGACSPV